MKLCECALLAKLFVNCDLFVHVNIFLYIYFNNFVNISHTDCAMQPTTTFLRTFMKANAISRCEQGYHGNQSY